MCAARVGELQEKLGDEAEKRMLTGKKIDPSDKCREGRATDPIGGVFGVSGKSVDRAA